jgi:glycosyltransferase involved in cell wall biosynthesis
MSTLSTPRFVYSSSPDRGLDNVMGLWPEIKKRWPDAELDVFYGWNMVDAITSRDLSHPLERFRRIIMGAWEQLGQDEGGIHMRGRVPQAKLAEELMQKTAWLYPTTFLETFCITAVEMQLAGVVPVASKLAALNETVGSVEDLIEGWPGNVTYQKQWLNMLEITMEDHDHRAIARERNRLHAEQFTWDSAYEKWNDLFYSFGITSGIAQVAV